VFVVEEVGDAGECVLADLVDQFFELLVVVGGVLAGVGVDGGDEDGGSLAEELVQLFEMFVHLGD
jgi:hypothetical protein